MRKESSFLTAGAGSMYQLDPDRGRAQRALLQDKATSACRKVRTSVEKAQADLANCAHGLLAEAKSALQHEPVEKINSLPACAGNWGGWYRTHMRSTCSHMMRRSP